MRLHKKSARGYVSIIMNVWSFHKWTGELLSSSRLAAKGGRTEVKL